MTQDEIIRFAILCRLVTTGNSDGIYMDALTEFANLVAAKEREALAQEQEPVAWMYQEYRDDDQFGWRDEILFTPPPNDPIYFRNITPVYTHPPQRTWVGLTKKEVHDLYDADYVVFHQRIEAKLKEKNT